MYKPGLSFAYQHLASGRRIDGNIKNYRLKNLIEIDKGQNETEIGTSSEG